MGLRCTRFGLVGGVAGLKSAKELKGIYIADFGCCGDLGFCYRCVFINKIISFQFQMVYASRICEATNGAGAYLQAGRIGCLMGKMRVSVDGLELVDIGMVGALVLKLVLFVQINN